MAFDRLPPPDPRRGRNAMWTVGRSTLVAALIILAYFTLPMSLALAVGGVLTLVLGFAVVVLALVWEIRMILVATYPAARAASALIVTVPLFGVVFATIYYLMSSANPQQWSEPLTRMDSLYFTVTVFATVGFGDITPLSQAARLVTTIQMLAGLTLVGVIARVVVGAVHVNRQRRAQE